MRRRLLSSSVKGDISSYIINLTDPEALAANMIIKDTPSKQLSASKDAIAWIHENTEIVAAIPTKQYESSLYLYVLKCGRVSRADKTKWADGTSISNMSNYDFFIKLPEFWWKCEELSTDIYEITFSIIPLATGWNHWEGNTFIGVYKGSTSVDNETSKTILRSTSGLTISGSSSNSTTHSTYSSYASSKGGNEYTNITYEAHCIMAFLGYGWYGTTDISSLLIVAYWTSPPITGVCNSLGITDGKAWMDTCWHSNFWGIEDWWGGNNEWICNLETSAKNTLAIYNTDVNLYSKYIVRTITLSNASTGCIGKMILGSYGDLIPTYTYNNTYYGTGYADIGLISRDSSYIRFYRGGYRDRGAGVAAIESSYGGYGYSNYRLLYKGQYVIQDKLE